jgi:hypothetical protein
MLFTIGACILFSSMTRAFGTRKSPIEEQGMLNDREGSGDASGAGLAISVVLVLLVLTGTLLAHQIKGLTPSVGDIIAFRAGEEAALGLRGDVRAFVADLNGPASSREACMLRVQTMLEGGGSMVVEGIDLRDSEASYRVHWAGGPTGADNVACSNGSDLFVSREVLMTLAAAGGIGVGHRKLQVLLPEGALAYSP